MKTLIVPTDFSPVAINAMNYAAEMALSIDASLLLVHVYQVPVTVSEVPVVIVPVSELKSTSEARLTDLKKGLQRFTNDKIKIYTEAILGDTIDELKAVCERIRPLAVVMGTHGVGGWEKRIMGSTALSAIRHLKFPVMAIPPGTTFKGLKKIGLACDYKDVMHSMPIELIRNILSNFTASLEVLNVDYNKEHFDAETPLESAHLESLLGNVKPNYHFLNNVDVTEGIMEFAETNNLDMIMVIPKKHKLLEGLFRKSHTGDMVEHSHIPVMALHD
jgi:nucleotide-binding universal stress UspA family protein